MTQGEIDTLRASLVGGADASGEGDLSLRYWREAHEGFFRANAEHGRGFSEQMPVVLERFELLVPTRSER